jgi:hypothetical protein
VTTAALVFATRLSMFMTIVDEAMSVGAGTDRRPFVIGFVRCGFASWAAGIKDEARQHTVLLGFNSGDGGAMVVPVETYPSAAVVADWRRWGHDRRRCGGLRHRTNDGIEEGAVKAARGSITRGDGAATSRRCDIAAVGGTLGESSVLAPHANKPINWLRQQHIVHRISRDAVNGRDEVR